MSEEVKEAIRLCNNVIENADYMEYEYMKEYKKSSIDILVKEIERLNKEIKEKDNEIIRLDYKYGECKKQELNEYAKNRELHSIIKEVREKCDYLLNNDKVEINGRTYIKQEADNVITNYIKEVLDKENI